MCCRVLYTSENMREMYVWPKSILYLNGGRNFAAFTLLNLTFKLKANFKASAAVCSCETFAGENTAVYCNRKFWIHLISPPFLCTKRPSGKFRNLQTEPSCTSYWPSNCINLITMYLLLAINVDLYLRPVKNCSVKYLFFFYNFICPLVIWEIYKNVAQYITCQKQAYFL